MNIESRLLKITQLKIWEHQKDAIREIAYYLNENGKNAFLVKMPTGTGKTGVFSCLSRIAYPDLNYIIITPSTALKFQIIDEVRVDFWTKIDFNLNELPDKVIEPLLPSDFEDTMKKIDGQSFILVSTIQSLQRIASESKYKGHLEKLKKMTDCIIFDEGHKEPAYTWGQTVRDFKKPTILFSATPYRNDYKIFNIDKGKFYSLEHSICEKESILRSLEIKKININVNSASLFVNDLVFQVQELKPSFIKQGITNPKIIIRCNSEKEIKEIVKALKSIKKLVLGIHQNFKETKEYTSSVPNKNEQKNYEYFVHQFKLIEGIDNPDFCIVALFSDFSNTRLLIQQIGRVLRNPKRSYNQYAYLFGKDTVKLKHEWKQYLTFDTEMTKKKKIFDVTDVLKVNKDLTTLYFSGAFRDLIDVNNISLAKSLLFQKKINIFSHNNTTSFSEFCEYIFDEWSKRDFFIVKHEIIDENVILLLYIKYENSPLVKEGIFVEQKLCLTYMQLVKNHLFYYDSEGNNPIFKLETLDTVTTDMLTNLMSNKKSITKMFLHNTDLGSRSVRSREVTAASIESTAPALADHSYFASRIEGYVLEDGQVQRRYIGFQNGRVTDHSSTRIDYHEFKLWLNHISVQINVVLSNNKINNLLNRYSKKVSAPTKPIPVSILLDIDDDILDQFTFGDSKQDLIFDNLCLAIYENRFDVTINSITFNFEIKYVEKYKRFQLICPDSDDFITNINPDSFTLLTILNSLQCFRIIIEGNKYIYAHKSFFKPGLNLISKKRDLDLKQLFHCHTCVNLLRVEKGNQTLLPFDNLWHPNTLFGLISRLAKGYSDPQLEEKFSFDHLICDDLGNEIADFIGLDLQKKRVVFLHAKVGDSKLSATAFQEVCGQATKNLDYLNPYFSKNPASNIEKWSKPWQIESIGKIDRIIKGNLSNRKFWEKYNTLISDPSVSREVWLMVGNTFDYNTFVKELNKNDIEKVKAEVIQIIYLLRSTWNSVSSVGAQLKIFC